MSESDKIKFELGRDYYLEKGAIIFTESYLVKRGKCCGSKCINCPYEPKHTPNNTKILKK